MKLTAFRGINKFLFIQKWQSLLWGLPLVFSGLFLDSTLTAQSYNIDDVDGEYLVLSDEWSEITIYDSGGPNSVYQNNEDYEVTICSGFFLAGCPDPPELNAIFVFFDVEGNPTCSYDGLQINGGGIFCNDNLPPGYGTTAISYIADESGCITLRFYSDFSVVNEGFSVSFVADHVQTIEDQSLICGSTDFNQVDFAFHGCPSCVDYYECYGDDYGPYWGSEVQYDIEADGPVTLTVEGNVDFFVYGRTTIVGPNGCPPISGIACATGSQQSVSFNASDYPYGIWVIIDAEFYEEFSISLDCNVGCDPCQECFAFLPRYQNPNLVDFQNRYCESGVPNIREEILATTYRWTVLNTTVQYTNGTNSLSENPSIIFPGGGTYTVCEEVFVGGILVFDCCRTVIIGSCSLPPVAHYTSQFFSFNNVFKLTSNANGNHVRWSFSDPDVTYWSGTEFSPSPEIQIPSGKCVMACLYVTNACGTSSYCTEICLNNAGCTGTIPPVYISNPIVPVVDLNTIDIDLPNPPGGGTPTYSWDFGDGNFASTRNITHTYDDEGNYNVCVVITVGCRTWCYCWCIPINPCVPDFSYNDGEVSVEFTGSETSLQYTFSTATPKAPGESWLINNSPVNGNTNTLTYIFPSAGNYTVCFPYIGNDGCVHYYCVDVGVGNPFACNNITWQFAAATGYRFTLPSGSSDIEWIIDETGQQIGNNATSNWVFPANPCTWRTISVRYFDGARYRICCLRIYLCPPDDCYGSIDYGYLSTTNQATFKLNASGATDISWFYDDTPTQILGIANNIVVPYPGACVSRWVSVKYKDGSGRWRICCRLIYFCNPVACNLIRVNFTENSGYSFSVDQAQENMSWILEETGTSLGTGMVSSFVPAGQNCDYRTVSLRYWVPGFGWQLCCVRFYWCNPITCGDIISTSTSGNSLVLQAPDNLQNITWYENGTLLSTANPFTSNLSASIPHNLRVRYFDPCDNAWKWCGKTYTPGSGSGNLTFDFDNRVCGESNQTVEIPLKVRGFNNLKNFQFSVQVEDTLKGKLIALTQQNISGDFETNVFNAATGIVFWESPTELSLSDNTIIAIAKVKITSTAAGEVKIRIAGTPTPVYAENGQGTEIVPVLLDGSFCFENLVNVCGKITREDLLPIGNVQVSLNGCKRYNTVTDANGNYCFNDIPAGASYEIRASKDINYKNGVNSGDLTAIKRHILGSVKLSTPYRILAADAKKSNAVNSGDVSELRRLILGQLVELPSCESWEFTDKNYSFQQPDNPFASVWTQGLLLQNIQDNVLNADLVGWKMGDVNNSNNPASLMEDPEIVMRNAADIYLIASSVHVPGQDTFLIDISTRQFEQISNGQFSVRFDPDQFVLHGITHYHSALDLSSEDFSIDQTAGSLGFVWGITGGITLPDDAVLFSLKFTSKVPHVDLSEIYFSQEPVSYYFENEIGEELNVITTDGHVTVPTDEIRQNEFRVYPNPNTGTFNLAGLHGEISYLEILDSRGSIVYKAENISGEKVKEIHLNQTGVYFLRLIHHGKIYSERIVVIQ